MPALIFDAPFALLALAVAFAVDRWLGIFISAAVLTLVVLTIVARRQGAAHQRVAADAAREAGARMNAAFRQGEAIRAMGMLPAVLRRWIDRHEDSHAAQARAEAATARVTAVARFVRIASQSLVLALGAVLVLEERITPGMMIRARGKATGCCGPRCPRRKSPVWPGPASRCGPDCRSR